MRFSHAFCCMGRPNLALVCAWAGLVVCNQAHSQSQQVGAVFVIDLENRNWTQPASVNSTLAPLFGNAAAPYINSLVTPGNPNAQYVSYGTSYHNDIAGPTGPIAPSQAWTFKNNDAGSVNLDIHPSEPNYLWQEAGLNFGKYDDNDPYGSGLSVQQIANYLTANPVASGQHLTGLLQAAGIPWKSYQEDIDMQNSTGGNTNISGSPTNTVLPQSQWTVPLASFSGTSTTGYVNPYNGSSQYNFACKHDGTLFFSDTNGTASLTVANTSTTNPEVSHYAPLYQLATDLTNNTVASYNLITPNQYNDMHTALGAGFTYNGTHYSNDLAQIAQGDNFLSIVVPMIMASQAFQNNGVIIIWTDETEGANQDAFTTTLEEIVISKLAVGNAFNVTDDLTHSSDLATLQEIFAIPANTTTGFLNDAANPSNGTGTADLTDFFQPGVIPHGFPAPANSTPAMPCWAVIVLALALGAVAVRFLPNKRGLA